MKIQIPRHPVIRDFAIVKTLSGTYVCPGWHPVPPDTTRADIELVNITPEKEVQDVPKKSTMALEFQIPSSNGKSMYTVKRSPGGVWSCNCPATQYFSKTCKHIKKKMEECETINMATV